MRKGFLLVTSLLLTALLFVCAGLFLASRVAQRKASTAAFAALQAREMAWAGLEDCRLKILKDYAFPPKASDDLRAFSYTEIVRDGAGRPLGSYTVQIDVRYAEAPYRIYPLISVGSALNADGSLRARHQLRAEFDLRNYRFLTVRDLGEL